MALLHESVHAKAANAFRRDGKVALLGRLELGGLAFAHDGANQRCGLRPGQPVRGHFGQLAIDLDGRREVRRDEHVAAFAAEHQLQQFADKLTGLVEFHDGRGSRV